ncbi:Galactose-binding domain protein [Pseudocohnilembus persalinus]|uniref:Galactose-binding domain protein n=1 Tax=Pseudocohnilembus persalinus TaxID=266149 RepID=A0A0V0QWP1_PSEPJ|nr:Galactose-binding domain protein [Pseudocohnilembus persalinus]|eukprot:KRX06493.1 Galactose-binding domain protein [Pseudocohnilembus persalinus]
MFGAFKKDSSKQHEAQQNSQNQANQNPFIYEDLEKYYDESKIQCLNYDPNFPAESCLKDQGKNLFTRSDADEQLIINIGFKNQVRLHHIKIIPAQKNEEFSAPKTLKIFINKQNMLFFEDNQEGKEKTGLAVLRLYGQSVIQTNFNVGQQQGEGLPIGLRQ